MPFASLGEPFDSDFPLRLPTERSIGKDRISEILVLVNITEKTTLPEFSVRVFVLALHLRSQTVSRQKSPRRLLTASLLPQVSIWPTFRTFCVSLRVRHGGSGVRAGDARRACQPPHIIIVGLRCRDPAGR